MARANVLLVALLGLFSLPCTVAAWQLWALWDLDLGDHAPPQHFLFTVEHSDGFPVPPPTRVPWARCTAFDSKRPEDLTSPAAWEDARRADHCTPIGCPPAGTYRFFVQAQFAEGLSDRSNIVTCRVEAGTCSCSTEPAVVLRPPAPTPRPTPPAPPPPLPTVPPGLVLSPETPPLVQVRAEDLPLVPVGGIPATPIIPPIPAPLQGV